MLNIIKIEKCKHNYTLSIKYSTIFLYFNSAMIMINYSDSFVDKNIAL